MSVSYICAWCGDEFDDVVQANDHQRDCSERPRNELDDE